MLQDWLSVWNLIFGNSGISQQCIVCQKRRTSFAIYLNDLESFLENHNSKGPLAVTGETENVLGIYYMQIILS